MTWLFMKESCFFVLFNFSHRDLQNHGAFHLIPIGKPLISKDALSLFHNFGLMIRKLLNVDQFLNQKFFFY
jgi:hypothetical protein